MIKATQILALVLKLDLMKAYDRVDQTFLYLVLLQVGLNMHVTNWIMVCVSSTIFVVLINGSPSAFFKSSRGIHHGCLMSPFLFLSMAEALSRLVLKAQEEDKIPGNRISS